MGELQSCPFCGNEVMTIINTGKVEKTPRFAIACAKNNGCGGSAKFMPTVEEAIKLWNTRTEPKPKALTLAELKERVGEPVWVETMNEWRIVVMAHDGENVKLYNFYNCISVKHVLNNDGRIYDKKPRED